MTQTLYDAVLRWVDDPLGDYRDEIFEAWEVEARQKRAEETARRYVRRALGDGVGVSTHHPPEVRTIAIRQKIGWLAWVQRRVPGGWDRAGPPCWRLTEKSAKRAAEAS